MTHPTGQFRRNSALGTCRDVAGLIGILRIARPNVLILGPDYETRRTIEAIRPHLATPIATWETETPFRTLVVEDVDRLTVTQQQRLFHLIIDRSDPIQIVATSQHDVFAAVESGAFMDRLYYQLNVILLDLLTLPSAGLVQPRAGSSFATT